MALEESVWLNDAMVPLSEGKVSVQDRGFLYGDGFFETIRAEQGKPQFLAEHLERLKASAQAFRIPFPQEVNWQERLHRLLQANALTAGTAAVKILLTRGELPGLGLPTGSRPTLVIYARPYEPPGPEEYSRGWPVVTFPERRTTFVGRHKSLNYLFYLAARQYALDQGAREALVLEADGLVSEGAATSIIFAKKGGFFSPQAPSALAGVTVAVLARSMQKQGLRLEWQPIPLGELLNCEGVWLANSLMGVMPLASVDGVALPVPRKETRFLQECLALEAAL
uniref:Aminotransferase class IV n=1 Tax=Desulfobacca acetoxidans TaxID=60893 RepID=A0A7C3WMZ7_9BACT